MESAVNAGKNSISLENTISTVIRIPGIKVNRESFLREQFKDASPELLQRILEKGPVEAKCPRSELRKKARKLIQKRTAFSTGASFAAGLPGGLAMAVTIPADMLQFYGVALGMAQEIAYLYGEGDLWSGDMPDSEKVKNQLSLYCGVMLGATGASQAVRVLSSSLAKQMLKKLPQQALTKTFYYPIIKSIAKAFGAKMTKEVFAKGVSKAVPLIGGVVSGGITFATLPPMGVRLTDAFDQAHFSYSDTNFEADWKGIKAVCENEKEDLNKVADEKNPAEENTPSNPTLKKIQEAKQMLDAGIINDGEYSEIKAKLIAQM